MRDIAISIGGIARSEANIQTANHCFMGGARSGPPSQKNSCRGYDESVTKKDSARLQSEREIVCPCCNAVLVIDLNLGRVISHSQPSSGLEIELSDAERILADAKARRDAAFEQSFNTERTKGDALSKRFEEALKQAKEEPITKPTRDFDLD